jgi:hypothetical protein
MAFGGDPSHPLWAGNLGLQQLRVGTEKVGKIGYGGKSGGCPFLAANPNPEFFFNADGKLKCIKGVEAKFPAHERFFIRNSAGTSGVRCQLGNDQRL